jgi:hypothetical protein
MYCAVKLSCAKVPRLIYSSTRTPRGQAGCAAGGSLEGFGLGKYSALNVDIANYCMVALTARDEHMFAFRALS